jgi:DNA mismatch repair protein MutL
MHPLFILNLEIDPSKVDVNVHPAKDIVKMDDEEFVKKHLFNAIKEAIEKSDLVSSVSLNSEAGHKAIKQYAFSTERQSILSDKKESSDETKEIKNNESIVKEMIEKNEKSPFSPIYLLGQINKTYIIAENPSGLLIIDQHAAEERVNYEKFMSEYSEKAVKKQSLINSKVIELNPIQYQTAMNNSEFLAKLGFEFSDFGSNSIKLSSIPEIFGRLKSTIFIDILNELVKNKNKSSSIDKEIEERIIRFSCRASVKAGDELTMPEMKKLIDNLGKAENPYSCPHGRPTIINFSLADLEKKFKRIGW